jgi:hypothetical protein
MTTTATISRTGEGAPAPLVIERFLRDRESVWRQIAAEEHLGTLSRRMLVSSSVSMAIYGGVVGIAHSLPQALASALKLPVLFLLTLAICLPTLYLFNLVWGGRLSARQVLALLLATITVTSALSLAFAPITLFFLITAQSYPFFVLLNTAILALTGGVGLSFLVEGTRFLNKQAEGGVRVNGGLLYAWLLLYAFVGTQLGWTLRPFFGDPGQPFVLFRALEGNFYGGILDLIGTLIR